jgi:hypothetical protein
LKNENLTKDSRICQQRKKYSCVVKAICKLPQRLICALSRLMPNPRSAPDFHPTPESGARIHALNPNLCPTPLRPKSYAQPYRPPISTLLTSIPYPLTPAQHSLSCTEEVYHLGKKQYSPCEKVHSFAYELIVLELIVTYEIIIISSS